MKRFRYIMRAIVLLRNKLSLNRDISAIHNYYDYDHYHYDYYYHHDYWYYLNKAVTIILMTVSVIVSLSRFEIRAFSYVGGNFSYQLYIFVVRFLVKYTVAGESNIWTHRLYTFMNILRVLYNPFWNFISAIVPRDYH